MEKEIRIDRYDLPVSIAVDLIDPSPFPGRLTLDDLKIEELAESIKKHGILQSLIVRRKPPKRYELVIGNRRLEAAKRIGMKTVPCIIRDMTDGEVQETQLTENEERKDFSDYETALKYESMLKNTEEYPTQEVLAFKIGKTQPYVAHKLRMLQLRNIMSIDIMLKLPSHHVEAILDAPSEKLPEIVKWIEEHIKTEGASPSVRQIKDFAKTALTTSETPISDTTIKHEDAKLQHPSENQKAESCDIHAKTQEDKPSELNKEFTDRYGRKWLITYSVKERDFCQDCNDIVHVSCDRCHGKNLYRKKRLKGGEQNN